MTYLKAASNPVKNGKLDGVENRNKSHFEYFMKVSKIFRETTFYSVFKIKSNNFEISQNYSETKQF